MSSPLTFHIAGIPVHVLGLERVTSENVTVLFFLHGRLGKWQDNIDRIQDILNTVKTDRPLIVVTFDQRNHGHREVHPKANTSWKEDNTQHAADMHSIQVGTARDVSTIGLAPIRIDQR